jgi:RNA 3'-terminal phosphate cyclase
MEALTLDGSHGEMGGQILRTALSLPVVAVHAFRLVNIRARRCGISRPPLRKWCRLLARFTVTSGSTTVGQVQVADIDNPGSVSKCR